MGLSTTGKSHKRFVVGMMIKNEVKSSTWVLQLKVDIEKP